LRDYDIQPSEWELARYWDSSGQKIRRRVDIVIDLLGKIFNGREPGGVTNLVFETGSDYSVVGTVRNPIATGRFKLEFVVLDTDLVAKIIVQREGLDKLDRKCFRSVWAFYIAERGHCFAEVQGNRRRYPMEHSGSGDRENSLFDLGMSISYALVTGPLPAVPNE
jgi:hypothetical protein